MSRQLRDRQPLGWPIRCLVAGRGGLSGGALGGWRGRWSRTRGGSVRTLSLGFRPCAFLTVTGRLCPTCGMTTAFAWFMRGRIDRSWQANPAGCLFALLSIPLIAWLVASAVANEPVGFRSLSGPLMGLLAGGVPCLSLASWLIRLIVSPAVLVEPRGQASRPWPGRSACELPKEGGGKG